MNSAWAGQVSKKLLEGALTAALLALLLFSGYSPLQMLRVKGRKVAEVPETSPELKVQLARRMAFFAAQQNIRASFPPDMPLGWCSETNATFTQTPTVDFIALQADYQNAHGKRVNQHWIVRLDPQTNGVLGKITWEK